MTLLPLPPAPWTRRRTATRPPRTGPATHASPDAVAVRLRDGGTALLRPLAPGEAAPLLDVFDQLSPASRASRYLVGLPRLPEAMRTALVDVDGCRHAAWLATVDGRAAGIARFVRTGPDGAEVAFEVVDRHHGRGVGAALVDAVTTVAAARGVRRLEATALPDNDASVHVLRRLGLVLTVQGGVLEGAGDLRLLDPARVDRTAVLALADRTAIPAPEQRLAP